MTTDVVPTMLGIALVAAAAAFALVPFARPNRAPDDAGAIGVATTHARVAVYRQLIELEFDRDLGKLSDEDYRTISAELLNEAAAALRNERGALVAVDAEIEREIAAARAAFAAARRAAAPTS
ncbi:MAG: hypothetical protein NVSMB2_07900 [Chloroflexota bacterium]